MATIGALIYRVQADTKDFQQGMKATRKEVNAANRVMRELRTPTERYSDTVAQLTRLHKLGTLPAEKYRMALERAKREYQESTRAGSKYAGMLTKVSIAFAAVTGAVYAANRAFAKLQQTMGEMDETAKAADKMGMTTEELIGLRHAAVKFSGMGAGAFDTAMQRMSRRVAEAAQGTGEAQKAIAELGLDAQKLARLGPTQTFLALARAIQEVENPMDQLRLSFKFFDSEGAKLATMLAQGDRAIVDMMQNAERLGLTFSRFDASKIEAANDALEDTRSVFQGISQQISIALAPAIQNASEAMTEGFNAAQKWGMAAAWVADMMKSAQLIVRNIAAYVSEIRVGWERVYLTILKMNAAVQRTDAARQAVTDQRMAVNELERQLERTWEAIDKSALSPGYMDQYAQSIIKAKKAFQDLDKETPDAAADPEAKRDFLPFSQMDLFLQRAQGRLGKMAAALGLTGGPASARPPQANQYAANTAVMPGSAEAFRLMEENRKAEDNPVNESNQWLEQIAGGIGELIGRLPTDGAQVEVSL